MPLYEVIVPPRARDVDPTTGIVEDAAPAGDENGAAAGPVAPGSDTGEGAPN